MGHYLDRLARPCLELGSWGVLGSLGVQGFLGIWNLRVLGVGKFGDLGGWLILGAGHFDSFGFGELGS